MDEPELRFERWRGGVDRRRRKPGRPERMVRERGDAGFACVRYRPGQRPRAITADAESAKALPRAGYYARGAVPKAVFDRVADAFALKNGLVKRRYLDHPLLRQDAADWIAGLCHCPCGGMSPAAASASATAFMRGRRWPVTVSPAEAGAWLAAAGFSRVRSSSRKGALSAASASYPGQMLWDAAERTVGTGQGTARPPPPE